MRIRDTIEDGAAGFAKQVVAPVAERVRDTAEDLLDRLGSESREISERVSDRIVARIEDLSETALANLNLTTTRRARQQTWLGVLVGFLVGAALSRAFSGQAGMRRRDALKKKFN